jgi:protocatechuate 3,4-dioxygenase alpha subunit
VSPGQTPSQTVGPFFAFALTGPQYGYDFAGLASGDLAGDNMPGERICIVGRVLDGEAVPVGDAMIEIWQADAEGRYAHPADPREAHRNFRGFGRFGTGTDPQNRFLFHTVKPGAIDGEQAPHINVIVFMRGLLSHAYTRIYFSDEAEANARDPVLLGVPAERRPTLIARRDDQTAVATYYFDIHMQGDEETVFFDV